MTVDKGLLMHWWHYYGKVIYFCSELQRFEELIDKYGVDKILNLAVISFVLGDGSPTALVLAIRNKEEEELINSLPGTENLSEADKKEYNRIKETFVKTISSMYK